MPPTSTRRSALLAPAVLVALILCALLTSGAAGASSSAIYVALGDSYTSGPLIPNQHGDPIDCGRSDHNYPSLVAQALAVKTFIDVSCGSAQTKDMTGPQTELPLGGTNPPQFNALRRDATLVTVGIGGNDAGLVGVATRCAELGTTAPTGTACRDHYAPGGHDLVAAKIEGAKPKIAAVLQGIHARSPNARVAIVGYPDVLPKSGNCYPMVPLSPDDMRYFDELIIRINTMIAGQAAANDAEYVDTYADSAGHDVCKLPPNRWFEGITPTEPAYPLHPNAKGEASMGRSAIALLRRPRPPHAPKLSRLRVAPRPLRAGRAARISYRLDRAAAVTFTLRRVVNGRYTRVLLTWRRSGRAGLNRVTLSGRRLRRRAGLYRIAATPKAAGLNGTQAAARFRLFPARR